MEFSFIDLNGMSKNPDILELDNQGNVWFGGTAEYGFNRYAIASGKVDTFRYTRRSPVAQKGAGLPPADLNDVTFDRHGRIWVSSYRGAYVFDWHQKQYRFIVGVDSFFYASTIRFDDSGNGWIGTRTQGVIKCNENGRILNVFQHRTSDPGSIVSNSVLTSFIDRKGNIWFGTMRGVSRLSVGRNRFKTYKHNTEDPSSISDGQVVAIEQDKTGRVWIAIPLVGIDRFDPTRQVFRHYLGLEAFPQPHMRSLYLDERERLVVSAFRPRRYDTRRDIFVDAHEVPKMNIYPPSAYLREPDGTRWYGFNGGILRVTRNGERTEWRTTGELTGLRAINVRHLYRDRSGTVWVSSPSLHRFNPASGRFVGVNGLFLLNVHRAVNDIIEDSDGGFWLAMDVGLGKYDPSRDTLLQFFGRSDVGGRRVYGIHEDSRKNIWAVTEGGIVRVDTRSLAIKQFGLSDRISPPAVTMDYGYGNDAHVKLQDGSMVFGLGSNGLVHFHPDEIRLNSNPPDVVFTGLWVNGEKVRLDSSSVLVRAIERTDTVLLHHDQNDISLSFAALDFTAPEANQYAYRLEPMQSQWIHNGGVNRAYFTNLSPGQYVLRVKASNNDGVWNEKGSSLIVIITPPWWRTIWAYGVYLFFIFGTILGLRRYELNRQRLKHQAELEHVQAEKLKDLDRTKSQFFANISHEFRTPLTLIRGPIEQLRSGTFKGDRSEIYDMVGRNTDRLLRLVNQLLDLSRLDAGQRRLHPKKGDIAEAIRTIAASFESLAARRSIIFEVNALVGPIRGSFDQEVLEQVLTNLLSNAFKFTPDGGMVLLDIRQSTIDNRHSLELSISDTGVGIPPEALDKVFDRFYQVDASQTREQEGTGIGLALTKELIDLHGGTIAVTSQPGKGTTFTVQLRIDLPESEGQPGSVVLEQRKHEAHEDLTSGLSAEDQLPTTDDQRPSTDDWRPPTEDPLPIVLVIDDNRDMRRYIRRQLEDHYRVIEASNGKDGLELAKSKTPDLVVSDVMMPKMDGFEVCRRLKSDVTTSHIPVVLLTAKAGDGHKLEGLETGADDYVVKPFDAKELKARLKNLHSQRIRMREAYRRELVVQPTGVKVESMDEQFLKKVFETIETRMSDPKLGPDVLARAAAVSRMTLHRKLKAITGMSAGELIRDLRLQRAHSLLQQKAGTVSEIAYQVGFNNLSHFARLFKGKFGILPSVYLEGPAPL
jgi:signal transduction histidine kinase/DNA-binding NarL/FixJ family response regulator/streptogramin lyase